MNYMLARWDTLINCCAAWRCTEPVIEVVWVPSGDCSRLCLALGEITSLPSPTSGECQDHPTRPMDSSPRSLARSTSSLIHFFKAWLKFTTQKLQLQAQFVGLDMLGLQPQ
eukprot:187030-Amphidinium_carterae.1